MIIAYLPPTVAFIMLAWFVFTPPIRPIPTLIATSVVALGAWLQYEGGRYTGVWAAGIVIHIGFAIAMLIRKRISELR